MRHMASLPEQLEEILDRESGYERARKRSLAMLARGYDLGTGGKASIWQHYLVAGGAEGDADDGHG